MGVPHAGRVAGLLLAGIAATSMLAACGGSSKPAAAAGAPNGANGIQAYTTCLTQHGVTLPSFNAGARPSFSRGARPSFSGGALPSFSRSPGSTGGFGGGGRGFGGGGGFGLTDPNNPPAGVDAATWSAALTACKSLQPTATGRNGTGFDNSALTAYRNCLTDHGVTASSAPGGFNTADPKVAAAIKACAPLRPTTGPTLAPSPSG